MLSISGSRTWPMMRKSTFNWDRWGVTGYVLLALPLIRYSSMHKLLLTVSRSIRGGVCPRGGGSVCPGGVCLVGVCIPACNGADRCKNITLPQTSFAGGKQSMRFLPLQSRNSVLELRALPDPGKLETMSRFNVKLSTRLLPNY